MPIAEEELRAIPYLAPLSSEALARVAAGVREHRCRRGDILFLEGEACPGIYYVRTGRVKVYKASPEGREQVLHAFGPGETFNDVPVFDGGPNPATAQTLEPSHVFLLPRETMVALVQAEPAVAMTVVKVFAARLRHLTTLVEDLSLRHVAGRVLLPLYVTSNLGVALRVVGELLGSGGSPGRGLVAASGVLGYAGLALFALVLWRTLDARPVPVVLTAGAGAAVQLPLVDARPGATAALTPDLTVAAVLARWPATLPVFLAHGFAPLANPALRAALAPRVTLAQAAAMRGGDLRALLADLAAAAGKGAAARDAG